MQVLQVALHPVHPARVAPLLEFLHRLVGVLFLHGEEEDLLCIVLEQMGDDSETNAGTTAGDDEDLSQSSTTMSFIVTLARMSGTLPERSGMSVLGSNLLPVMNDMVAFYGSVNKEVVSRIQLMCTVR